MTTARLAHQIAMIPSTEQEQYFRKACGVARFAYNWGLSEWQKQYTTGEIPGSDLSKAVAFVPVIDPGTVFLQHRASGHCVILWQHHFP